MTPSFANSTLEYDRLRDSLAAAGAVVAVAEVHGGVCGALCAGGAPAALRWLMHSFEDQELTAAGASIAGDLDALVVASLRMLTSDELAFEPLLPSDDEPLEEQVQGLALWCQGFLSGVGETAPGMTLRSGGGDSLTEILSDFAQISRAGLSDDEAAGRNQPDFALAELQEYVRVSVQIVFEDLAEQRAAAARDTH